MKIVYFASLQHQILELHNSNIRLASPHLAVGRIGRRCSQHGGVHGSMGSLGLSDDLGGRRRNGLAGGRLGCRG